MKVSKRLFLWIVLPILLLATVGASNLSDVCMQIVDKALKATEKICDDTGRNQACYGHTSLQVKAQTGLTPFKFDTVGDVVDVNRIKSLRLSPMDMEKETWGVALMRLQANIPDQKADENVTLLLFGDVEIQNAIDIPTLLKVQVTASGNLNIRREPSNDGFTIGTLTPGQTVTARGRSEDDKWVYVDVPESTKRGWVYKSLVKGTDDLGGLKVVKPSMTQYGPMQAFYLRTGKQASTCSKAPNDGILVQTPEGVAEVRLWINEVKIRLGSTAYIQSSADNNMTVKTVEGAARVEALGVEYTAVAGTEISVPMNKDNKPSAPPKPPVAYKTNEVQNLPVQNLQRQITVEPPATSEATAEPAVATTAPTATTVPSVVPGKTPVPTATQEVTAAATDTSVPVATDTSVPPTKEPPTAVPPTQEPPTAVPPTDVPPPPPTDAPAPDTNNNSAPPATSEAGSSSSNDNQPPPDNNPAPPPPDTSSQGSSAQPAAPQPSGGDSSQPAQPPAADTAQAG